MNPRSPRTRLNRLPSVGESLAPTIRFWRTALLLAGCAALAKAQVLCTRPGERLDAPSPAQSHAVGDDVAVQGNTALVGARSRTAVEVFEHGPAGWSNVQHLSGADTVAGDWFGAAVDLDGDTAIIGAEFDDDQGNASGAAYIFVRTGGVWTQQAKLLPPVGASLDRFGTSVAVHGDRVVVGALNGDGAATDSGTAHVFERNAGAWNWIAQLSLPDGIAGEQFGAQVTIDGERVLVGAPDDGVGPTNRGSATLFERTGGAWPLTARLRPSSTANADFGLGLAIVGSQILIGGPNDSTVGNQAGALWLFDLIGGVWTESEILFSVDIAAGDHFGADLDYSDGKLAVGAWGDDVSTFFYSNSGAAYVFEPVAGTWVQRFKLSAAVANSSMGWSVACGGDFVLAGAPGEDTYGLSAGTCFAFELVLAPQVYCTAQTNSLGCVPVISATGNPTGSGLVPFDLHATSLINRKNGLLCYSLAGPQSVPLNGGVLCVRAPFRRMPPQGTRGSPNGVDCTGFIDFDFAERVRLGTDPALVAGTRVWAQFWSRDPFAPASTNATAGIEFELCGP